MTENASKTGLFQNFITYLKEAREELKKVSWPSREQVLRSTVTVVIVSVFFAVFLGVADYFLNLGLESLLENF